MKIGLKESNLLREKPSFHLPKENNPNHYQWSLLHFVVAAALSMHNGENVRMRTPPTSSSSMMRWGSFASVAGPATNLGKRQTSG